MADDSVGRRMPFAFLAEVERKVCEVSIPSSFETSATRGAVKNASDADERSSPVCFRPTWWSRREGTPWKTSSRSSLG
jgi:hypothetical protein